MTIIQPTQSFNIHAQLRQLDDTSFYPAAIVETLDILKSLETFDDLYATFDFVTDTRIRHVFREIRHYDVFYEQQLKRIGNLSNRIDDVDFI